MSETYVLTVPFESKYAWILANAEQLRGSRVMHRIPTDVIIDLGQLECGCILDRPVTCVPWNPDTPDTIPEIKKLKVPALVKSAMIPPLPYPETFGAILKEQNERWVAVRGELDVMYEAIGSYQGFALKWNQESIEELCPDDILLMLAKETIQDNAKQEAVKIYNSAGKFLGFTTYIDRTKVDRNIWKEQYVLKNLGLPIYLKPKAYQPTTTTGSVTFKDGDGKDVTLTATLEGADKIQYKDDVGSGDATTRAGSKDTEAHCRCYTINAIVKPYMHVLQTPFIAPLIAGRPVSDDPFAATNWGAVWYNFFIAHVVTPAIGANGQSFDAVDTCVAVTNIKIDGVEASIKALHDLLSLAAGGDIIAEAFCTDLSGGKDRLKITFPSDPGGALGTRVITLELVWIYKVDIMKMDILVNDELISHIYCAKPQGAAPPGTPYAPVPATYIESFNENQ